MVSQVYCCRKSPFGLSTTKQKTAPVPLDAHQKGAGRQPPVTNSQGVSYGSLPCLLFCCWLRPRWQRRFRLRVLLTARLPWSSRLMGCPFNKDVLPILQRECQVCHRPGEAAPMSFLTYESTRPWAKAIKQAVVTRKMPPWFADAGIGSFRNDPSLTVQEIDDPFGVGG